MKRLLRYPLYVFVFAGLLFSTITKGDTWNRPGVKKYYSENMEFKLIVSPSKTPDKYYQWDNYKKNKHPQTKKVLRKKEKFMKGISDQDTILIPCTAELYRMKENDSILIWKRPLLNEVCPANAIVANDGSSIATFDNWYFKGYGVNVFVVYDNKGNAKKTYKLEEISPFPLNDYPMSITSLHWYRRVKYIDIERIEIVFRADDEREKKKIYNINKLEFEK